MTNQTAASRPILHEGEYRTMIADGLSNAELDRLLQSVDRKGLPYLSDDRIGELIASHKAKGVFGLRVGLQEGAFDAQAALQSLERAARDPHRATVAAQVKALDAASSGGRFEELERNVALMDMLKEGKGGVAGLKPDEVKTIACQYVQEVTMEPMAADVCAPSVPAARSVGARRP